VSEPAPAAPRTPAAAASRPPEVLIMTEQLGSGGKRSHVEALLAGLEAIGWRARLYDRSHLSFVERALVAGPARALDLLERGLGHRWMVPVFNSMTVMRLAGPGARLRADIYHSQDAFLYPAVRRVARGRPVALTVHGPGHREVASGYGLDLEHPTVRWLRGFEEYGYRDADAVISVDRAHAQYVRELGRTGPVWVIPNFVDTRRYHPEVPAAALPAAVEAWLDGRPIVLCPRRLVEKNGVDVAVRAARGLADRGVRAALLVAGEGPERAALDRRVAELGLEAHVRFLGDVSAAAMPGLCRRAALVVVPSVPSKGVEEATSIAVLEAQACARPVVASALGGLREIIVDGETGALFPPGDAAALAAAAARVLTDPGYAARLGAAAATHIREHHSHLAGARQYAEVYRTLVGGGPPAGGRADAGGATGGPVA
jgi:glycosyltransferase involved in cell wall biosynthesis